MQRIGEYEITYDTIKGEWAVTVAGAQVASELDGSLTVAAKVIGHAQEHGNLQTLAYHLGIIADPDKHVGMWSIDKIRRLAVIAAHKEQDEVVKAYMAARRSVQSDPAQPEGRADSCGFEENCYNFARGKNGNCVGRSDDPLECFVHEDDMKEPPEAYHGGR